VAHEPRVPLSGIIVSCQALPGSPLEGTAYMAAMARCAVMGGCRAVRVNGVDDIQAVREVVDVPILGINKGHDRGIDRVYVTPTFESARAVAQAGANVIAVDGTPRPRPGGESLQTMIRLVHDELGLDVLADVDSVATGLSAVDAGADYLATSLSGYTVETACEPNAPPDLRLLGRLVRETSVPVIAEGRIHRPEEAAEAFALGASAVVIGTAITNPAAITASYVRSCAPYAG
jgi:N-acylglucosamine-6-phosphate 2-epimerase